MHGVKASDISESERIRIQEKSRAWKEAFENVLKLRDKAKISEEIDTKCQAVTRSLLDANPNSYSIWNFRKEILLRQFDHADNWLRLQEEAETSTPHCKTPASSSNDDEEDNQVSESDCVPRKVAEPAAAIASENDASDMSLDPSALPLENSGMIPGSMYAKSRKEWKRSLPSIMELPEDETLDTFWDRGMRFAAEELEHSTSWTMQNSKNYSAWHHRSWLLDQITRRCSPEAAEALWRRELALTAQFLLRDSRNFHCWAYRREVLQHLRPEDRDERELAFTESKIGEGANFFSSSDPSRLHQNGLGNYSAWHMRSQILGRRLEACTDETARREILGPELDYLVNVLILHDGESPWRYFQWLLDQVSAEYLAERKPEFEELCHELITLDGADQKKPSKHALLCLLRFTPVEDVAGTEKLLHQLETEYPQQKGYYEDIRRLRQCN